MRAVFEIHNLASGPGLGGGGPREFAFVEEVDRYSHTRDEDIFGAGLPGVLGVAQEAVVGLDGSEIVAPAVAVPLRIKDARVPFIDDAVEVLILDVVDLLIGNLAFAEGEVPERAVVDGGGAHA